MHVDTWSVNSNKDMERRHTGMERGHTWYGTGTKYNSIIRFG